MDTQDTGTTEDTTSSTAADETTTGDTSTENGEDADLELKRIKDKKQYLKDLDREIKEAEEKRNGLKPNKKSETLTEDQDDVQIWMTVNSDSLKVVGKEFQEELKFYKDHKIPVTNEIRERALRDAKARKGYGAKSNAEAERQADTSTEVQGEVRKTTQVTEIPESIRKHNPTMTLEQYKKYKAEFDAKKK